MSKSLFPGGPAFKLSKPAPKNKELVKKAKTKKKKTKKKVKKNGKTKKALRVQVVDTRSSTNPKDELEDLFDVVSSSLKHITFPDNPDELPDPVKLLEQAIEDNFDTSVFANHDFPIAPNVIEWCRGHEYLNAATDLFPRQFQTLALFYSDVCFFCSDTEYVFSVPVDDPIGNLLDRFTLLQHGVCPICKRNREEIIQEWIVDPRFRTLPTQTYADNVRIRPVPANELCCVWGQRSGKSHMSSTYVATYQVHRYLSIPNPLQYYNEPSNKVIEGAFVATTLPQVNKSIWMPFRQALENSTWFTDMLRFFKEEGKRIGLKLFRSGQTYMLFPSKRLTLHMAAASSSGLRGGTRALGIIDELGWMNYDESGRRRSNTKDGSEVFRALHNSLTTLRNKASKLRKAGNFNAVDAIMVNVSSPSSKWDPIMARAELANQKPRIFYSHMASWDVNPDLDEEEICDEFAGELDRLYRDFYAIPPAAANPFFSDQELLEDRVYEGEHSLEIPFSYTIEDHGDGNGMTVMQVSPTELRPDRIWPRVLAVDNGEKKNSLALCLGRYLPEIEGVLAEVVVEVAPVDGKVIDLAWCHNEFVVRLVENFNIPYITYDRWNSGYSFYDLRMNKQVIAERYSLKGPDFKAFKDDLLGENIWFNEPEAAVSIKDVLGMTNLAQRALYPRTHLLVQILTVNEFNRTVVKPEYGNDDLFRTLVLCHRTITKYKKDLKARTKNLGRRGGISSKVGAKRPNTLAAGSFSLPRSWYGPVPAAGGRSRPRSRQSPLTRIQLPNHVKEGR